MRTFSLVLLIAITGACGDDRDKGGDGNADAPAGGDAAIDAAPLTLSCSSYCTAILATCTGALQQYGDMAACLGSCAHFTEGALGETSGNTLGCRIYHTEAAQGDAEAHCEHAGPGGGSMCGATSCEGFCSIAPVVCPMEWKANTCANNCAAIASVPPYSVASTGNTIECRLYHATIAATDAASATTHCPHTDRMNSATCQ
jgi:hypothetical protein